MSSNEYVPNIDTMRDCFLDGAEGNFVAEDFDRAIAAIKAEAKVEALKWAAGQVHLEARWQAEQGKPTDRWLMVERIIRDRIEREASE